MNFTNQQEVLDLLLNSIPKSTLVKILTQELNLTRPTVYKYLDNQASISYDNMQLILSLPVFNDIFLQRKNNPQTTNEANWQHNSISNSPITPLSYLQTLDNFLSALVAEDTIIHVSSYEIPIFYYLYYPRIFAFKLYCWSHTVWANNLYGGIPFHPDLILAPEILDLITSMSDKFNRFNTKEYWTESLFDNTIRQINYFKKMDFIRNIADCRDLSDDLSDLTNVMHSITKSGEKVLFDRQTPGGQVDVFRNDLYFTNNIFIIDSLKTKMIFSAFDNPNYMITTDKKIFDRSIGWLKGMRSGCTSLTQTNDIVRKDFFDCLEFKLENLEI